MCDSANHLAAANAHSHLHPHTIIELPTDRHLPQHILRASIDAIEDPGTRSLNQDSGNANGATKQCTTCLTATSYSSVSYADHGDIRRSTVRFPTVGANLGISVELAMTTPTTTTPSVVWTSRLLDEARDINRGVMSQP